MRYMQRILASTALLLALVTLSVKADSGNDELEQNRRLLEKWRTDPEHYESLRRNLRAFLALPEEHRARLRQLDQDLREEDSATSVRLQRVLERYTDWLQRLPEADRQRIRGEADPKKRLQLIREIRQQEWVKRLPKAIREDLQKLPADQQRARIAELRKQERKRRQEWQVAIRNWAELTQTRPLTRLEDLTPEVKTFVYESLLPMLNPEEKNRLLQAQGEQPRFLRTLVELADKHPIKLPGPSTGPAKFDQLPAEVQTRLAKIKDWPPPAVQKAEGKWPDYAQAVTAFARTNKVRLPKQLGPSRPAQFSASIQQFREEKLLPVLDNDEKERLSKAEGYWPGYPRTLLDLARKHRLQVPGMALPGPREMWDKYRSKPEATAGALPEVPVHTLLEFARTDLSAEEQANLPPLWFTDSANRMQVNQLYLDRNPKVLQHLRQADLKAQQKNQTGKKK